MKKLVKNDVFWVGKTDWELRKFHGDEYSTHLGSSYNSYLIKGKKNILIDTVWKPFSEEFVSNLKEEIDLKDIDYVIVNHAEIDHSGALSELMKQIPETPIYCTQAGIEIIKGHHHQEWNFKTVKTGDKLDIGDGRELVFIEMKMLHWPDSMATYLTEDNILFSNDAFGQHYASEDLFNDLVDKDDLMKEAIKYYANILNPFSALVKNKIKEILELKIPIDIIATSHGIIWRDNPVQIIEKYMEWADAYQENQVTILYDTMWDGTKQMAESIAEGIQRVDPNVKIKLYNSAKADKNDIVTEVFKSKMILVGSSTINSGVLHSIAGILELIKGLKFKNKKAAAFGSFGWSGESVNIINDELRKSGFEVVNDGIKVKWSPDGRSRKECYEFGKSFAI